MKKTAVLSISGGLDSTCLLLHLLSEGFAVKAYSFDYGQKHKVELEKLEKNIDFLTRKGMEIEWSVIDLRSVFSESTSSLHEKGEAIPEGHYADDNMKSTVVENRNIIFSSIVYGKALSWSKKLDQDISIYLGIHAGDHTVYPDTREESRLAAELCFKISNWGSERVSYKAPFVDMDKAQVLKAGLSAMDSLNLTEATYNRKPLFSQHDKEFVLRHTHTCYNPNEGGESCGRCGSCTERLEAFEINGLKDPAIYYGR